MANLLLGNTIENYKVAENRIRKLDEEQKIINYEAASRMNSTQQIQEPVKNMNKLEKLNFELVLAKSSLNPNKDNNFCMTPVNNYELLISLLPTMSD